MIFHAIFPVFVILATKTYTILIARNYNAPFRNLHFHNFDTQMRTEETRFKLQFTICKPVKILVQFCLYLP